MAEKVNLVPLKELEGQLSELLSKISEQTSRALLQLEEQNISLITYQNELASREQNVIRMERSIRNYMQKESALEERLSEASNKQNTIFLQMQLLETEKEKLQNTLEQTEARLQEVLEENETLTQKNAEYLLINQKLSDEKAKLLKLQIEKGGI